MNIAETYAQKKLQAKCDFFVESQLWPLEQNLNHQGWLNNFLPEERRFAECLLDSFLFFSSSLTGTLFRAAFRQLARHVIAFDADATTATNLWSRFTDSLYLTYVTGELPSPTDSGHLFTRHARQILGISESNILSPDQTLEALSSDASTPVVFVDDFVGSGNQFVDTWNRIYDFPGGRSDSFSSLFQRQKFSVFYCPVLCTSLGRDRITKEAPEVKLSPAHFLDSSYSVFSPDTTIWPDHLRPTANAFLQSASSRAGITRNWKGFCDQGLLVSFSHCVPDATIPLIDHKSDNWTPLINIQ